MSLSLPTDSTVSSWDSQLQPLTRTPYFTALHSATMGARPFDPKHALYVYGIGCMQCHQPANELPLDVIGFHLAHVFAATKLGITQVSCLICRELSRSNPASSGRFDEVDTIASRHIRLAEKVHRLVGSRTTARLTVAQDSAAVSSTHFDEAMRQYEGTQDAIGRLVPYARQQIASFEAYRRLNGARYAVKGGWSAFRNRAEFEESQAIARLTLSGGGGACELAFDEWMDRYYGTFVCCYTREGRRFTSNAAVCGPYTAAAEYTDGRRTRLAIAQPEPIDTVIVDPAHSSKKRRSQEAVVEAIEGVYRLTSLVDELCPAVLPVRGDMQECLPALEQERAGLLLEMQEIVDRTKSTAGPGFAKRSLRSHELLVERASLIRGLELPRVRALLTEFNDC